MVNYVHISPIFSCLITFGIILSNRIFNLEMKTRVSRFLVFVCMLCVLYTIHMYTCGVWVCVCVCVCVYVVFEGACVFVCVCLCKYHIVYFVVIG